MSDEHPRKGKKLMVDGQPLELSPDDGVDLPDQRMLPPGDSVYWVDIGDTVTFEDAYGYTAHALITHVEPPEETHNEESES